MSDQTTIDFATAQAKSWADYAAAILAGTPVTPPVPTPTPAPTPTPTPTPAPPVTPPPPPANPGFTGRSQVDSSVWTKRMEDDFPVLASEGTFLSTYGSNWGAYPTSYLTTSKKGYYEPNHISVVDYADGQRAMLCRLVPGSKNPSGKPSGCAAQPKIAGSVTYGLKGEKVEMRVRIDAPGDAWHAANLGWPTSERWPADGEIDFWEQNLTGTVGGYLHVQNGASDGSDQVPLSVAIDAKKGWVVIGYERVAGQSFKWFVNGQLVKTVTSRVPTGPMRLVLQLEDGGTPTQEARVLYDWITVWEKA